MSIYRLYFTDSNNKLFYFCLLYTSWERAHIIQGENDLYDYITELVGEKETSAIAQSWKLPKEKYHKERFISEVSKNQYSWKLSDMGLLIFNDELGIFWYEVDASAIDENSVFLDCLLYTSICIMVSLKVFH